MKFYIALLTMMLSTAVIADQRFETRGGFCHFVTPEGFETNNDDNEVFFANCENSIRQKDDGSGEGSTTVVVKYPTYESLPFEENYTVEGADTRIACVMVDSNNTRYRTRDWTAEYKVMGDSLKIKYNITCRNAESSEQ